MKSPDTEPLDGFEYAQTDGQQIKEARDFAKDMQRRRTVRSFSSKPVSREVVSYCLAAACSSPSGANRQPWRFVAVSDGQTKHKIRVAAEAEETEFYEHRAPTQWLEALEPLGTNADKPFLEEAPWLIAIFACSYGQSPEAGVVKNYYVAESVGIATGILITALHRCGLATLTHTPSPMKFLNEILGRPANERPYLLLVVGHPKVDCRVPKLERKRPEELVTFIESDDSVEPNGS